MALGARDLHIGRVSFTTLTDEVAEAVGDVLNSDEGGVAVARRRPRMYTLTIPVHGSMQDTNPLLWSMRMRRQIRAIMENADYRLQGLYMTFAADPELNGWLIMGSGLIKYAEGGVTFGEFSMELDSAYRVGSQRSHREARRVELYLRSNAALGVAGGVPHDIKGVVFGNDFVATGSIPLALTFLPVGATDVLGYNRTPLPVFPRAGVDGTAVMLQGLQHANVLHYERPEISMNLGDVLVYDRQGLAGLPEAGVPPTQDPQNAFGWEEVYGPDQPLTANDAVVLRNNHCRVRLVTVNGQPSLAVDAYSPGTVWAEQGRVTWSDSSTLDAYALHSYLIPQGKGALATVLEWTPERAVIRLSSQRTAADATARIDLYVTLQRGWTAPRFEAYVSAASVPTAGVLVWYALNTTGQVAEVNIASGASKVFATDDPLAPWSNLPGPTYQTVGDPWVYVIGEVGNASGLLPVCIATTQQAARGPNSMDSAAYGAPQPVVGALARFNETQNTTATLYGYVSLNLGFTFSPVGLGAANASPIRSTSATATSVADAASLSGTAVNDTQTSNGAPTLLIANPPWPAGRYGVWARVRVTTAGDTVGAYATLNAGPSPTATSASATYVWVFMAELLKLTASGASDTFGVTVWRIGGAGTTGVRVDRVIVIPTERRTPIAGSQTATFDGARDLGVMHLYDARAVPELVAR